MSRWVVVLAGGVGSRFWPLSTPTRPKQLLPLVDDRPLLVATLDRLASLAPPSRTLVLTNASLRDAVRRHAPNIPDENVIAEPRAVGTGGALAWAASEIERRDSPAAVMISVHADWAIGDDAGFLRTCAGIRCNRVLEALVLVRCFVHGAAGVRGIVTSAWR